jgi:hypothetical protein
MYIGGAGVSSGECGVEDSNGTTPIVFRILGQLEVAVAGCAVPLGGAKQRGLLAILMLSANEVVSSDRLIDELWGGRSPGSGRAALQVRVSQLRKRLGEAGGQLLTRGPGYVLRVDAGQLDLHRFEKLVGDADHADPAAAAVSCGRLSVCGAASRSPICVMSRSRNPRSCGWTSCVWWRWRGGSTQTSLWVGTASWSPSWGR